MGLRKSGGEAGKGETAPHLAVVDARRRASHHRCHLPAANWSSAVNPHTIIEVGREDPDRLFIAHHTGANPGEEYYRPACCLLWAAGSGKVLLPHPKPRN